MDSETYKVAAEDLNGNAADYTALSPLPARKVPIVGGILLLISGLFGTVDEFYNLIKYGWSTSKDLYDIFAIIGIIVFAIAMLKRKRSPLVIVGAALFSVPCLWSVLASLRFIGSWPFLTWVSVMIHLGSCVLLILMAVSAVGKNLHLGKIWFLPGILMGVLFLYTCYRMIFIGYGYTTFERIAVIVVDALDVAIWFLVPFCLSRLAPQEAAPATRSAISGGSPAQAAAPAPQSENYIRLISHVLLLIFTCGVWLFIWIYRTTRYLNRVPGEEERSPTTALLLSIFVPFYMIFWTYHSAQRLDKYAKYQGVPSDLSPTCLLLSFFIGIVPPMLMQEKINTILVKEKLDPDAEPAVQPIVPPADAPVYRPAPVRVAAPVNTPGNEQNTIEALRSYKELLDMGAITQEEFEEKKRQLLC